MALDLYRTDRVERDYDVTVKDENGQVIAVANVQVAVLPKDATPTADTTWVMKTVTAGEVTLVFAGPDATPEAGDFVVSVPSDVFFNDVNATFRKAWKNERINVM